MITPTHSLMALAALARPGERRRNLSVLAGSLIPDLAIFLWAPYQYIVNDVSGQDVWGKLYFEPPMQNLIAWFNSIPIYAALLVIGFLGRAKTWGKLIIFFSLAALIHIAGDLPVHADDAYRHFWPLSDWRFYSPLSYWDIDHHAAWVGKVDIMIALGSIAVLWQRFDAKLARRALIATAIFYIVLITSPLLFRIVGLFVPGLFG